MVLIKMDVSFGPERSLVALVALTGAVTHFAYAQGRGGRRLVLFNAMSMLALAISLMTLGGDPSVPTAIALISLVGASILMWPAISTKGFRSLPLLASAAALAGFAMFASDERHWPVYDTFVHGGNAVHVASSVVLACAVMIAMSSVSAFKQLNHLALAGWSSIILGIYAARALFNNHDTSGRRMEFAAAVQAICELVIIPMSLLMTLGRDLQFVTPLVAIALAGSEATRRQYAAQAKIDGLMLWRAIFRVRWQGEGSDAAVDNVSAIKDTCRKESEAQGYSEETYKACLVRNGLSETGEVTEETEQKFQGNRVAFCVDASGGDPRRLEKCLQASDETGCLSHCVGPTVAEPGNFEVCMAHNENLEIVMKRADANKRADKTPTFGFNTIERQCYDGHATGDVKKCSWLPGGDTAEARCIRGNAEGAFSSQQDLNQELHRIRDESQRLIENDDSDERFKARLQKMRAGF